MTYVKLFAPGAVLFLWWIVWAFISRSDRVVGAGLALLTAAVIVAEVERLRIRRELKRR